MGNPVKLCSSNSIPISSATSTTSSSSSINDNHNNNEMNQNDLNSSSSSMTTTTNMNNIKLIQSSMKKIHLNQSNINLINLEDDDDNDDDDNNNKTNDSINFIGKTWNDLNFDKLLNDNDDDAQIDDNFLSNKRIASDCTKLPIEDVDLFGRGPDSEPLFTVKCKACNRLIKASAFRRHIEIRHPHMIPNVPPSSADDNNDSNLINGFSQFSSKNLTSTNSDLMFNNNENWIKNGDIMSQTNANITTTANTNTLTTGSMHAKINQSFIQINGLHNGKLNSNLTKSINKQQQSGNKNIRRVQQISNKQSVDDDDDDDDVIEITNDINVPQSTFTSSSSSSSSSSLSSKSFGGEIEFLGPVNSSNNKTTTSTLRRKNHSNNNSKQQSSMFWSPTASNVINSGNGNAVAVSGNGGSNFTVIKGVYCGGNLASGNQVLPVSALHKSNGNQTNIVNAEMEQSQQQLSGTTGQNVLKFHEILVRSSSSPSSSNQSTTTTTISKSKDVNSILRTSTSKRTASELLSSCGNIPGNIVAKKSKPNNKATSTTKTVAITAATTTSAGGQQQQVIMVPTSMLSSITKQMVTNNETLTSSQMNGLHQQSQILNNEFNMNTNGNIINNNTTTISITTNCSTTTTSVSKMRSQPPSPMLMPPPPSPVVPKKRSIVLCKNREYDPDQHCGVQLANMERPCTRSLTCRSHMISLRRNVSGRSKPFDELLSEYKRERGMKERRERKPRNKSKTTITTSLSNDEITLHQQQQQLSTNGTIPLSNAIKRSLQAKISNNSKLSKTNVIHKDIKRISNNDQRSLLLQQRSTKYKVIKNINLRLFSPISINNNNNILDRFQFIRTLFKSIEYPCLKENIIIDPCLDAASKLQRLLHYKELLARKIQKKAIAKESRKNKILLSESIEKGSIHHYRRLRRRRLQHQHQQQHQTETMAGFVFIDHYPRPAAVQSSYKNQDFPIYFTTDSSKKLKLNSTIDPYNHPLVAGIAMNPYDNSRTKFSNFMKIMSKDLSQHLKHSSPAKTSDKSIVNSGSGINSSSIVLANRQLNAVPSKISGKFYKESGVTLLKQTAATTTSSPSITNSNSQQSIATAKLVNNNVDNIQQSTNIKIKREGITILKPTKTSKSANIVKNIKDSGITMLKRSLSTTTTAATKPINRSISSQQQHPVAPSFGMIQQQSKSITDNTANKSLLKSTKTLLTMSNNTVSPTTISPQTKILNSKDQSTSSLMMTTTATTSLLKMNDSKCKKSKRTSNQMMNESSSTNNIGSIQTLTITDPAKISLIDNKNVSINNNSQQQISTLNQTNVNKSTVTISPKPKTAKIRFAKMMGPNISIAAASTTSNNLNDQMTIGGMKTFSMSFTNDESQRSELPPQQQQQQLFNRISTPSTSGIRSEKDIIENIKADLINSYENRDIITTKTSMNRSSIDYMSIQNVNFDTDTQNVPDYIVDLIDELEQTPKTPQPSLQSQTTLNRSAEQQQSIKINQLPNGVQHVIYQTINNQNSVSNNNNLFSLTMEQKGQQQNKRKIEQTAMNANTAGNLTSVAFVSKSNTTTTNVSQKPPNLTKARANSRTVNKAVTMAKSATGAQQQASLPQNFTITNSAGILNKTNTTSIINHQMNKLKSIDHIDNNNVTTTVKPPKFTAILNGMNSEHHGQIICNPETLKTLNSVINSAAFRQAASNAIASGTTTASAKINATGSNEKSIIVPLTFTTGQQQQQASNQQSYQTIQIQPGKTGLNTITTQQQQQVATSLSSTGNNLTHLQTINSVSTSLPSSSSSSSASSSSSTTTTTSMTSNGQQQFTTIPLATIQGNGQTFLLPFSSINPVQNIYILHQSTPSTTTTSTIDTQHHTLSSSSTTTTTNINRLTNSLVNNITTGSNSKK
ncbi:uncharacterized protein LOC113789779 [Dermatophagoides pteronyssinus]|uniref:uncharacterized protein LOC113789779 n=1 Tax=Dermatophagoides pteronyssinus TaxID=6956 RepID=UPI003F6663D9